MVFAGYSGFLHYLQLASHELDTIGINVRKNKIQIQLIPDDAFTVHLPVLILFQALLSFSRYVVILTGCLWRTF